MIVLPSALTEKTLAGVWLNVTVSVPKNSVPVIVTVSPTLAAPGATTDSWSMTGCGDNWTKNGDLLILADALAESVLKQARVTAYEKVRDLPADTLDAVECAHPLKGISGGYEFTVPLLAGDHVTDDTGTGFVHTAPGHGREDFDVWTANARELDGRGISTAIPYTCLLYTSPSPRDS